MVSGLWQIHTFRKAVFLYGYAPLGSGHFSWHLVFQHLCHCELYLSSSAAFFALSWSLLDGFTHLGVTSTGQPWASTRWLASRPWIWAVWWLCVKPLGTTLGVQRRLRASVGSLLPICPQARAGSELAMLARGSGPPRGHSHTCMGIGGMSRPAMVSGLWQTRTFRKVVFFMVMRL